MTYILYDIETDSVGVFSSSSLDSNFPLENIRLQTLAKKFSFTGKTSEVITYLYETGITINGIGIQSNLTSSGTLAIGVFEHAIIDGGTNSQVGTDIIDGGTNSQVGTDIIDGAPTASQTINLTGADGNESGVIYYQLSSAVEISQLTFTFADSGNSDNIKVGRIAAGDNLELDNPRNYPKIEYLDTSETKISRSGQMYGIQGYKYRLIDVSYPKLTETQKDNLSTMLSTVGRFKPFFLSVLSDVETEMYATLDVEGYSFTHNPYKPTHGYTLNIVFREVF